MIARVLLVTVFILCCVIALISRIELDYDIVCKEGDLYRTYEHLKSFTSEQLANDPKELHALSALQLILYSDINEALKLHEQAKALSPSTVPPLAAMYLEGKACGGLGDLFYVTAVIIKQMSQSKIDRRQWQESLKQLITLTCDSGLTEAAEKQMTHAINLDPYDTSLRFRAALLTPGVLSSFTELNHTRVRLWERVSYLEQLRDNNNLTLSKLDEFSLSPTFYYIYQGYEDDRWLLESLHTSYRIAHPALSNNNILPAVPAITRDKGRGKVRIGFVSSFFRRHSICKLFCGLITALDLDNFDVVIFSSLPAHKEDAMTASLSSKGQPHITFIRVNHLLLTNRQLVLNQHLDILVYLDVGMEPSTIIWAAARLAPIQMALWGHPSTTGLLQSMDYYISSTAYHHYRPTLPLPGMTTAYSDNSKSHDKGEWPQSFFSEQLVQLDGLNFVFALPIITSLDDKAKDDYKAVLSYRPYDSLLQMINKPLPPADNKKNKDDNDIRQRDQLLHLLRLREDRSHGHRRRKVILITQTLPKLHPSFDSVILPLLLSSEEANRPIIVLLSDPNKKKQWQQTIVNRWKQALSVQSNDSNVADSSLRDGILWIEGPISPQRYLQLQLLGDLAIDPFPFGGGVTTLESLSVCAPVLTLPSLQTVPQLAAGMIIALGEQDTLIADSTQDMLSKAKHILAAADSDDGHALRRRLCDKQDLLFYANDNNTSKQDQRLEHKVAGLEEWNRFLRRLVD